jgi:TPR repeat protein
MRISKLLKVAVFWFVANQASADGLVRGNEYSSKERGAFFYNMERYDDAVPYLKDAARKGDRDSQFYLGQIYARENSYGDAALYWYKAAAAQGHITSIVILSTLLREYCKYLTNCHLVIEELPGWRESALNTSQQNADDGSGNAMYEMYLLTDDFNWLIRSARVGFARGQYRLGTEYRRGVSFFLTPGRRKQAVEKWILAAAENDYVPAIKDLVRTCSEKDDLPGLLRWTTRAVELGDFGATAKYVSWLSDLPNPVADPQDLIKAYGYTILLDEAESDRLKKSVYREYLEPDEIASKMTFEQIEKGKLFAEEWKRTKPPLAKYPGW